MYQGLGSYFCFSFLSYLYLKTHSLPLYIDEYEFVFSKADGQFWHAYFDSPIWTDFRSHTASKEPDVHVQPFLEFYHAKRFGNPDMLLDQIFGNNTASQANLRRNVDLIRKRMSEFWVIKSGLLDEFSFRATHELNSLADHDFLTLIIREGDKRTLEPHHAPTDLALLRALVLRSGFTHVHLITDSFAQFRRLQSILPSNVTLVSTCTARSYSHKAGGFVLKTAQRTWTPAQRDSEVLDTLFNYELARRARLVLAPATTNIGVWLNLLRLADGKPYSFVQLAVGSSQFNYFQTYLPVQFP